MEASQEEAADDAMSPWIQFFRDAGIESPDCENYAIAFVNHRIKENLLLELNKEYLVEMGITAIGHIIAILKQAKTAASKSVPKNTPETVQPTSSSTIRNETPLERLEKSINFGSRSLTPTFKRSTAMSRRSTPASRMVDHYLANEPGARLMSDATPLVSADVTKRLDFLTSDSANRKNSVFDRLGLMSGHNFSDKTTNLQVTLNRNSSNLTLASDLRDVLKRPATTTCYDSEDSDSDGSECQYAGVLKKSSVCPKKKPKLSVSKSNSNDSPLSNVHTEGIFGVNTKQKNISAKQRLGQKL